MDRSERRYRAAHKKARRLRHHWDYIGVSRGYLGYCGCRKDGFWWGCREIEKPWRIDIVNYAKSPGWWRRLMITRPGRKEANALLRLVSRGMDADVVRRWPDYRKPHIYYW